MWLSSSGGGLGFVICWSPKAGHWCSGLSEQIWNGTGHCHLGLACGFSGCWGCFPKSSCAALRLKFVEEVGCGPIWIQLDTHMVVKKLHWMSFSWSPFGAIYVEIYNLMLRKGLNFALRNCNWVVHNLVPCFQCLDFWVSLVPSPFREGRKMLRLSLSSNYVIWGSLKKKKNLNISILLFITIVLLFHANKKNYYIHEMYECNMNQKKKKKVGHPGV